MNGKRAQFTYFCIMYTCSVHVQLLCIMYYVIYIFKFYILNLMRLLRVRMYCHTMMIISSKKYPGLLTFSRLNIKNELLRKVIRNRIEKYNDFVLVYKKEGVSFEYKIF